MSTWVSRPTDPLTREWHLEAPDPRSSGLIHAACGRTWQPSVDDPLDASEDLDKIPESARCPACQGVYVRRLPQ